MFAQVHIYKGKRIHRDGLRWVVLGYGTSHGGLASNVHVFQTLRTAKAFIDHMQAKRESTHDYHTDTLA